VFKQNEDEKKFVPDLKEIEILEKKIVPVGSGETFLPL
jgi:hypothetical protein